ncbi:hypothetical protein [Priestia aryabhattai]|uniref:hypothetical protein n=1 Tax=Priestia aryabhattai TaxID=412384 RepID=UPI002E1DAF4A|nr:hypothetical protein [Priestia aryabhattai]
MIQIDPEKQVRIEKYKTKSDECFENNDYETSIDLLVQAWGEIPQPKGLYPDTYNIVRDIIDTFTVIKNYKSAKQWLNHLYTSDFERIDDGEREFLSRTIYYELGELNAAKEFFDIANKKSEGRSFEGQDVKYIKLLKGS